MTCACGGRGKLPFAISPAVSIYEPAFTRTNNFPAVSLVTVATIVLFAAFVIVTGAPASGCSFGTFGLETGEIGPSSTSPEIAEGNAFGPDVVSFPVLFELLGTARQEDNTQITTREHVAKGMKFFICVLL